MAAFRQRRFPADRRTWVALLVCLSWAASAAAQSVEKSFCSAEPGSRIAAIARVGNTVYVGGAFSTLGPNTGGGVPLGRISGAPSWRYARVAGTVRAVVPDGEGGWYIGGRFTAVEGVTRGNLAHVRADGSVAAWAPEVGGVVRYPLTAEVRALASHGRVLYVGGVFTTVNGWARGNVAAVDAKTGSLLDWDPGADLDVSCLVARGRTVYAGGAFTTIGGRPRRFLAALDAGTGAAIAWDPGPAGPVKSLLADRDLLYTGGEFTSIGGKVRKYVAALDARTGAVTDWDAKLGPDPWYGPHGDRRVPYVAALALRGRTLYAGGSFDSAGGRSRGSLAALDTRTAATTAWDPEPSGGGRVFSISALAVSGDRIIVGGGFSAIGGRPRPNIVAVDAESGVATAWNPRANSTVAALGASRDAVYAGGEFTSVHDWQPRNGIAAIDARTGSLTDWNPMPDVPYVTALAVKGDTLYVGGAFTTFSGRRRSHLAAVDAGTGEVTDWDPGTDGGVNCLVASGNTVYAAGAFHVVGGQPRHFLAATDAVTGAVTPWDPALGTLGDFTFALAAGGNAVYVGGDFYSQGRGRQNHLIALDAGTGAILDWNPDPEPWNRAASVYSLALSGSTVYAGGGFTAVGGRERRHIAALDAASGVATDWDPGADAYVHIWPEAWVAGLAVRGNTVYAGGDFTTIGGRARSYFAALDATTGALDPWDPQVVPPDTVHSYYRPVIQVLSCSGDMLYLGGCFQAAGGFPHAGLAAIRLGTESPRHAAMDGALEPRPPALALAQNAPNPARSSTRVRFTLPAAAAVSLSVFDIEGRRIASLLDHALEPAGQHEVPVNTTAWRAGVYFCRLEACGTSLTRKLLVVH
jgi:trimeric autotransporter adhesin